MSNAITARHPNIDSAADRASMRERLDAMAERCAEHKASDAAMKAWMKEAQDTLTRVKFAAYLMVILLGTIAAVSRWTLKHAIDDALIERGLIVIKRSALEGVSAPEGKVAWNHGTGSDSQPQPPASPPSL